MFFIEKMVKIIGPKIPYCGIFSVQSVSFIKNSLNSNSESVLFYL